MPYDSRHRPGMRTSVTVDPLSLVADIDEKVRRLDPEATPLQAIGKVIGRGKKPHSHKVQSTEIHAFDHWDFCSSVTMGVDVDSAYSRFALMTLDQSSRPLTNDVMYYAPQDKMTILSTGQTVMVVATPRAALQVNGSDITFSDTNMTGNTTSRTADGTVLVMNVEPAPLLDFTTSDVVFTGRTIKESQDIEAESHQTDILYDYNYVEHKEAVIIFTEDQKKWIKTRGTMGDFNLQQEETIRNFKKSVDYNAVWSEREADFTDPTRPMRHMRGLFHAIQTNVAYYDPNTVTDFEMLLVNFLHEQAYRYNPSGTRKKMGYAGGRFLINFNDYFREFRRTTDLKLDGGVKLGLDTYEIPGGFSLTMVRNETLRQDTDAENWLFVLDPVQAEWAIVKDYESRLYSNNNERDVKYMIEWQGTIRWHLEQSHALLRT